MQFSNLHFWRGLFDIYTKVKGQRHIYQGLPFWWTLSVWTPFKVFREKLASNAFTQTVVCCIIMLKDLLHVYVWVVIAQTLESNHLGNSITFLRIGLETPFILHFSCYDVHYKIKIIINNSQWRKTNLIFDSQRLLFSQAI